MKLFKSGGFVVFLLLIIAAVLRVLYPPLPREIKNLATVSGDLEAGNLIFKTRLPLFKSSWVQAIGVPDEKPATIELVRAYVDALQRSDEKVDAIISGSTSIDKVMSGVQHGAIKIDQSTAPEVVKLLLQAESKHLKVLIILSSTDGSHRTGPSVIGYLETQLSMQIPVVTLAGLALTEDAEPELLPVCDRSPFSDHGQVLDLGCLILSMSKRAQVEKPSTDHDLVSIEEESADEELVAIYRPRR